MNSSPSVLRGAEATHVTRFNAGVLPTEVSPHVVGTPVGLPDPSAVLHFDQVYATELASLREKARSEGHEQGYAEGMKAAEEAVAEVVAQAEQAAEAAQTEWEGAALSALQALATAVEGLDARVAPVLDELSGSLGETVFALVEDLLGRELAASTDPGRDAVERALRLVPADAPVTVRVNPADLARLDSEWLGGLPATVRVIADPVVEAGGASAEAGARRVDAQLSSAVDRVRQVLLR